MESAEFSSIEIGSPSDLVVNVSETLQRWTNGHLPAGLHRVNLPGNMRNNPVGVIPARRSIAYFTKADRHASVGPLKAFVADSEAAKYQDMTAVEYHQQRLVSAY